MEESQYSTLPGAWPLEQTVGCHFLLFHVWVAPGLGTPLFCKRLSTESKVEATVLWVPPSLCAH